MKQVILALLLSTATAGYSQTAVTEMITTEKKFAAYSVAHNTRDAFLQFMDTTAIMFDKGIPVNGYQLWKAKPVRPGILNWRPRFAEVAASGDFGYTCGPWTFQPKATTDSVVANGYFFTIWQKKENEWKFIFDGGTDEGEPLNDTTVHQLLAPKNRSNQATMIASELVFNSYRRKGDAVAYKRFLSATSILCGNKTSLMSTAVEQQNFIATLPAMQYLWLGTGLAPGGDMGFIYGTTITKNKKDFYFHVWRKQPNGWKLAVEMLRF